MGKTLLNASRQGKNLKLSRTSIMSPAASESEVLSKLAEAVREDYDADLLYYVGAIEDPKDDFIIGEGLV